MGSEENEIEMKYVALFPFDPGILYFLNPSIQNAEIWGRSEYSL